jgi:hypothetical protein
MLRRLLVVAPVLGAALVALPAGAGTDTDQLTGTATVLSVRPGRLRC